MRSVLVGTQFMLRLVLIVMAILWVVSSGATPIAQEATEEPVIETATPTATETPTLTPTLTQTSTLTETITSTPTLTTLPPTSTPLIETVVVPATVVVTVPVTVNAPMPIQIPPPTNAPVQVIPTSAATPTRSFGWERHESVELIQMVGAWQLRRDNHASNGAFHETTSAHASLRFPFTGDGLRLISQYHPQGGRFVLMLDDELLGVFDTFAEEETFFFAGPFFFDPGYHVLDVITLMEASGQDNVVVDAVDVFFGPAMPTPIASSTPSDIRDEDNPNQLQPVASINLISQAPTPQLTPTSIPETLVVVEIIVAYDLNRNGTAESNEGVQGMSVRMLDGSTNDLLVSGLTDERGYVRLQALTANTTTVVVPFLGETFNVRPGRGRNQSTRWTLLLDAANQPGLIP
ncbi:MAG: hypothetical protein RLP44_01605 [Aggregatilineales bacterium]